MAFANSHTAKIHYTVKGDASQTLVLLMGLGGHASEWGETFVSLLAEQYRVVTLDNRGIAESETRTTQWSLDDMAQDTLAVIDALGSERVFLAGTSMGGMIAQLVASEAPDRIAKLALMSTSPGGRETSPPTAAANALFVPGQGLTPGRMWAHTLAVLTAPGFAASHPELIAQLAEQRDRVSTRARVFGAQLNAIMNSDRSERMRKLKLPTLVLHGVDDQLVPVENGRMLARLIPGARLTLFEHCGHFPHLEIPQQNAAELVSFFG